MKNNITHEQKEALVKFMKEVCLRPGMYTGITGFDKTATFLNGYFWAIYDIYKTELLAPFSLWMAFRIQTSKGYNLSFEAYFDEAYETDKEKHKKLAENFEDFLFSPDLDEAIDMCNYVSSHQLIGNYPVSKNFAKPK